MRWWWLVAVVGSISACVLELDAEIACGDGFVDRRPGAGEECDPGDDESFLGACENGNDARCDPATCELDRSVCVLGCGNGIIEPGLGEECELDIDDLVSGYGKACTQIDDFGPGDYWGGVVRGCSEIDCKFDRIDCHWCGDGQRRLAEPHAEVCDDVDVDPQLRAEFCMSRCPQIDPAPSSITCQARCRTDCSGLEEPADGLRCCLPSGETVVPEIDCCNPPLPGDPTRCGPGLQGG